MNRRTFIRTTAANLAALALGPRASSAALGILSVPRQEHPNGQPEILPSGAATSREISLVAEPAQLEIPSHGVFDKWLFNGQYPGPEIRAKEGERLRLNVKNNLPEGTTIHWHGIPLQNKMDGVPNVTQPPILPGESFTYEFDAKPAGSFLYHSHFGLQPDRGLVGPLVLEEKKSHISYDREYTLCLTDFLPGAPIPLGHMMNARGVMAPMQVPPYTVLLINGRPPEAPAVFSVKSGERVGCV